MWGMAYAVLGSEMYMSTGQGTLSGLTSQTLMKFTFASGFTSLGSILPAATPAAFCLVPFNQDKFMIPEETFFIEDTLPILSEL